MFALTALKSCLELNQLWPIWLHYHCYKPELISCAEQARASLHLSSEVLQKTEKRMCHLGKLNASFVILANAFFYIYPISSR